MRRRCPNCQEEYDTVLERDGSGRTIQEQYPDAPTWQREQLLSGICSDDCWKQYLGTGEEE
jgi:hypothetical protein